MFENQNFVEHLSVVAEGCSQTYIFLAGEKCSLKMNAAYFPSGYAFAKWLRISIS